MFRNFQSLVCSTHVCHGIRAIRPRPNSARGPDRRTFADWIARSTPGSQISLYLHVPFCRRLCWFCACRTQGTSSDGPVVAYAQTLEDRVGNAAPHLARGVQLSRLHWGGRHADHAATREMRAIAALVFDIAPLAEGGEFSVEIDPNEIDERAAGRAGRSGADPRVDRGAGFRYRDSGGHRPRPEFRDHESNRDAIRARGIESLNADILYGLPHQTPKRLADSVQKLADAEPGPRGALWLCACAVDGAAPADDPPTHCRARKSGWSCSIPPAACSCGTGMTKSGSTISRARMTGWQRPPGRERCGAISRVIPTTGGGADRVGGVINFALSTRPCAKRAGHRSLEKVRFRLATSRPCAGMPFQRMTCGAAAPSKR